MRWQGLALPILIQRRAVNPFIRFASSISSTSDSPREISQFLRDVPQISGSGPFPAEPTLSIVGTPGSLIHVSLPASGGIFARRGSIVAVNGSLQDLTSKVAVNQSMKSLSSTMPILYQSIISTTPASFLISTNESNSSCKILNVSKSQEWIIAQRNSLLSWNQTVNIEAVSRFAKWGHARANGSGVLALVGKGDIMQLDIEKGDSIMVNPSSLVAYSVDPSENLTGLIKRIPHLNINFDMPQLKSRFFRKGKSEQATKSVFSSVVKWIKYLTSKFWKDDIAFKINGPRTIYIQTKGGGSSTHLFTTEELKSFIADNGVQDQH